MYFFPSLQYLIIPPWSLRILRIRFFHFKGEQLVILENVYLFRATLQAKFLQG